MFIQEGERFIHHWQLDLSAIWTVDKLREDGDYDCSVIEAKGLSAAPDVLKRARFTHSQIRSCVFLNESSEAMVE